MTVAILLIVPLALAAGLRACSSMLCERGIGPDNEERAVEFVQNYYLSLRKHNLPKEQHRIFDAMTADIRATKKYYFEMYDQDGKLVKCTAAPPRWYYSGRHPRDGNYEITVVAAPKGDCDTCWDLAGMSMEISNCGYPLEASGSYGTRTAPFKRSTSRDNRGVRQFEPGTSVCGPEYWPEEARSWIGLK
jgi:hypothetical protein